jgi:ATP-binding cassette subfamily B protein
MYREPDVLVLDEGTSALDGATERALVTAIDESAHGRTLIAIAHRISTIRSADRIYVVADGRIRDHGTYDELLVRDELFQSLT